MNDKFIISIITTFIVILIATPLTIWFHEYMGIGSTLTTLERGLIIALTCMMVDLYNFTNKLDSSINESPKDRLNNLRSHSIDKIKKLIKENGEFVFDDPINCQTNHGEILNVTSVKFIAWYNVDVGIKLLTESGRLNIDTIEILSTDSIVKLAELVINKTGGKHV